MIKAINWNHISDTLSRSLVPLGLGYSTFLTCTVNLLTASVMSFMWLIKALSNLGIIDDFLYVLKYLAILPQYVSLD